MRSVIVTATAFESASKSLPFQHSMLHVSAVCLDSSSETDAFDVLVDERGELAVVLLDIQSEEPRRRGLCFEALGVVRQAVQSRAPLYEIVAAVRSFATCEPKTAIGLSLLRFSQPESRVELLNAGMPAIACTLPDGRVSLHPSLSPSIGRRFGDVHPYELSPLVWGSSWFLLSDGATAGKTEPDAVRAWLAAGELQKRGAELSRVAPHALARSIGELPGDGGFGDKSFAVIHSDPSRRFRSGIVP